MQAYAYDYTDATVDKTNPGVVDFTDDVIVIDDDQDDRETVSWFFGKVDPSQNIRTFKNGEEFINMIQCQDVFWHQEQQLGLPKLILIDMHMPVMDGAETIKHIRAQSLWKDVPIILLTGTDDDIKIMEAYDVGANAFLSKPFNHIELLQAMHHGFNYGSTLF